MAATKIPNAHGAIAPANIKPIDELLERTNNTFKRSIAAAIQGYNEKMIVIERIQNLLRKADLTKKLSDLSPELAFELITPEEKRQIEIKRQERYLLAQQELIELEKQSKEEEEEEKEKES